MISEEIFITPIGYVQCTRMNAVDDHWDKETSSIVIDERFDSAVLEGLSEFSHLEVIYHFHEVDQSRIITGSRHPRNNPAWPKVGIFAQRGKNRPNRIGATICELLGVRGRIMDVNRLDAIDGSPVIDIKPIMQEFLPRGEIRQPEWSREIMTEYWTQ